MTRAVVAGLLLAALCGCGFMQVGERDLPPAPGAVAVTEWDEQGAQIPPGMESAVPVTDPQRYVEQLVAAAFAASDPGGELRHGILNRDGTAATGYIQVLDPTGGDRAIASFDVRLALARDEDGHWSLAGVETRQQCREPLTAGTCGNTGTEGSAPSG